MKKRILTAVFSIIIGLNIYAQAPESFNYQSVLRNASGEVLSNQEVEIGIAILQGSVSGPEVFSETHITSTNGFGLVNLQIGSVDTTGFETIDWSMGPYYIQISVDGTVMGTSQLLSVPYALFAGKVAGDNDVDSANELQDISLSGTQLSISKGSTVDLSGLQTTSSDNQTLSLRYNRYLGISNGNTISLPFITTESDGDPNNEIQVLSIKNDTIFLSNGGFVKLPAETDPLFSGSQAANITSNDITNLGNLSGTNTGDQDLSGLLQKADVKDSIIANQANITITEAQITDLDHFTNADETDPVYAVSQAANITATDITNLSNLSGTNTGDQDLSGLLQKADVKDSIIANQANITITEAQISDLDHFTNADETDPVYAADSSFIKSGVRNWNNSLAKNIMDQDTARWGQDTDPVNELQALSISNDTVYLTNGGFIKLPSQLNDSDRDTKIETEQSPDEDIIRMSVAGNEAMSINNTSGSVLNLPTSDDNSSLKVKNSNGNVVFGVDGRGLMNGDGSGLSNLRSLANTTGGNQLCQITANYAYYQNVRSVTFEAPSSGKCFVMASGYARWESKGWDLLLAGILRDTDPNNSWDAENEFFRYLNILTDYNCADSSDQYASFAQHRTFSVSAGTHTFTLWANKYSSSAKVRVDDVNLTVLFFPTSGTGSAVLKSTELAEDENKNETSAPFTATRRNVDGSQILNEPNNEIKDSSPPLDAQQVNDELNALKQRLNVLEKLLEEKTKE